MADSKKGDNDAAQKAWEKTKKPYETAMADCKDVAQAFEDIEKFKDDVLARKDVKDYLDARYKKYKAEIDKSFENEIGQWDLGVYFNSGMFAGYGMQYYGLAPERKAEEATEETRDPMAPAQFVAGWFYGVSTEDKTKDILACYKKSDDLTNDLYDAMDAYIKGDQKTGDAKMKDTKALYDTALSACSDVGTEMKNIGDKADALVKRSDWKQLAEKIYNDNKDVIDRDIDLELREWKQGVFFNSGMFAGQIEQIFLKDAPEPEPKKNAYSLFAPF